MSAENLRTEKSGALGWIILDRPAKLNALTDAMREGILEGLAEFEADPEVRVVLFRGEGDAFCAGTDVGEFAGRSGLEQWERDLSPLRIFERIQGGRKPTVAALHGHVYGGGCELALACDIRVSAASASFGQLEVRWGLIPGGGGTQRLTRLVGRGQAMRLILSGDVIDAGEAARIGLVELVVEDGQVLESAAALAARIAGHDAVAVRLARESIRAADEVSLSAGLRYEASLMGLALYGGNSARRIKEFTDKTSE